MITVILIIKNLDIKILKYKLLSHTFLPIDTTFCFTTSTIFEFLTLQPVF